MLTLKHLLNHHLTIYNPDNKFDVVFIIMTHNFGKWVLSEETKRKDYP